MARPGRHPLTESQIREQMSPTEMLVEEIAPPDFEMVGDPESEDDPVRPWEPKGLTQTNSQITVEGVDLHGSPPPARTAGGSPPNHKKPLGQFGPEGT